GTDEWTAQFDVSAVGWHEYQIVAWVDRFLTWRREITLKAAAGQDVSLELLEGSLLVRDAAARAERLRLARGTSGKRGEAAPPSASGGAPSGRAVRGGGPAGGEGPEGRQVASPASPLSGSTSSICRPFIRSARASAKGATMRSSPLQVIPGVHGRSDRRTAATRRSSRGSAPSRISNGSAAKPSASASRSRSISRGSARLIIRGCRNILNGSGIDPTARSST